ncbi:MAG: hypothetical protein Q3972_05930 [Corynebacterium sp.]|nr:hypothetical protein [Corynebacterium sp.]
MIKVHGAGRVRLLTPILVTALAGATLVGAPSAVAGTATATNGVCSFSHTEAESVLAQRLVDEAHAATEPVIRGFLAAEGASAESADAAVNAMKADSSQADFLSGSAITSAGELRDSLALTEWDAAAPLFDFSSRIAVNKDAVATVWAEGIVQKYLPEKYAVGLSASQEQTLAQNMDTDFFTAQYRLLYYRLGTYKMDLVACQEAGGSINGGVRAEVNSWLGRFAGDAATLNAEFGFPASVNSGDTPGAARGSSAPGYQPFGSTPRTKLVIGLVAFFFLAKYIVEVGIFPIPVFPLPLSA